MTDQLPKQVLPQRGSARIIAHPNAVLNPKQVSKACYYKVALPLENGIRFLDPRQIAYCQASGNYTNIVLQNGDKVLISKTLKWIEGRLPEQEFYRSHGSFIVAVHSVSFVGRDFVRLENGVEVAVSRRKREPLLKTLFGPINLAPRV